MVLPVLEALFDEGDLITVSAGRALENGSTRWRNQQFDSTVGAERWLRQHAKSHHNVYAKFARFDGAKNPSNGYPAVDLKHVTGSATFFADLDCGPGQSYGTLRDAATSLNHAFKVLATQRVPPPSLLQISGHGLQAAWITDTVFGVGMWQQINKVLYDLLQKNGVQPDKAAMSIDRGLRLCGPEFHNYKRAPPVTTRLVYLKERIVGATFRDVLLGHASQRERPPSKAEIEQEYGLPSTKTFEFHVADVVDHCEVLKEANRTSGRDHGFALWSSIIAQCARDDDHEAGDSWAHHFSSGHEGYQPDVVDKKLDSFRRTGSALVFCKTFAGIVPQACASCRFNGVSSVGKIPGLLRQETLNPDPLPDPAYTNGNDGVWRKKKLDTEDDVLVLRGYHLHGVELIEDMDTGEWHIGFSVAGAIGGFTKRVKLAIGEAMSDPRAFRKTFTSLASVPLSDHETRRMFEAMASFVTKLRAEKKAHSAYSRLGWADRNGPFILGSTVIGPQGGQEFYASDPEMRNFHPTGEIALQQHVISAMLSHETRPEMHALFATSLAAVLTSLCGEQGIALNFHSTATGAGKTSMAEVAAGSWGKPSSMIFTSKDTQNAIFNQLGRLRNLPAYFDDPLVHDPKRDFKGMVFSMAGGHEKRRLDAHAKQQPHGTWNTLLVCLTNHAFTGVVDRKEQASDATAARFLDFEVPPMPPSSNGLDYPTLLDEATYNYGFIGPLFVAHVLGHLQEVRTRIGEWREYLKPLILTRSGDNSGRYQVAACACIATAAEICADIGLAPVRLDLVQVAIEVALRHARINHLRTQKQATPEQLLRSFLHENTDRRVTTEDDQHQVKRLTLDHKMLISTVLYEVDMTNNRLILDRDGFYDYLGEHNANPTVVMRELAHLQARRSRLARGTRYSTQVREVLAIDLTLVEWQDLKP